MISKDIYHSDGFLSLSASAKLLYTYLDLNADDDGFASPLMQKLVLGVGDEAENELIEAGFLLPFPEAKVVLIVHWLLSNRIQGTRHTKSQYQKQLSSVMVQDGIYFMSANCRHRVT